MALTYGQWEGEEVERAGARGRGEGTAVRGVRGGGARRGWERDYWIEQQPPPPWGA